MIFSVTTYCTTSNGFVTYQPLEKKNKKISLQLSCSLGLTKSSQNPHVENITKRFDSVKDSLCS